MLYSDGCENFRTGDGLTMAQLTENQKAKLDEYAAEAFAVGNCTDPIDRIAAKQAITKLYAFKEIDLGNRKWIFVKSPWQALRLEYILNHDDPDEAILNSLGSDNDMSIIDRLTAEKGEFADADFSQTIFGSEEAFWVYFNKFQHEVMGEQMDDNKIKEVELFGEVAKQSYWHMKYDKCMIVSDRPVEKLYNSAGQLHSTTKSAFRFADGHGLYFIDGHRIPKYFITNPEKITVQVIDTPNLNTETRRIAIEIYGPSKYLSDIDAKVLDVDSRKIPGAATRALMEDASRGKWLVGTDGSTGRVYIMPVQKNVNSCKEAHESISGLPEDGMVAES